MTYTLNISAVSFHVSLVEQHVAGFCESLTAVLQIHGDILGQSSSPCRFSYLPETTFISLPQLSMRLDNFNQRLCKPENL